MTARPRWAHQLRPFALSLFAFLLIIAAVLVTTPGSANADTQSDLQSARVQAERVSARLALLEAKQEWTNERLAYAREQLAAAVGSSVTVQEQLDELTGASADASAELAHRVRAIEQSGGPMALYSQALTGTSIAEVASNLAALNALLGTGQAAEQEAITAVDNATQLEQRLDHVADERAQLVAQVHALSDEVASLADGQADVLATVDSTIKQLARELAREREAAAAVAAVTSPTAAPDVVTTSDSGPYAEAAIDAALSKLGSPYVWGDEGPDTFDCSGLVLWSYAQAGLSLPRLASDQYFASTPVSVDAMAPGDLLVYAYDINDDQTIHHITMYIGNGQMVHAPRTGDVVKVVPVYYDGLYGVARPGI